MDFSSYVRTAKSVITANSPVLLLGTTIAGVATTGVLAAKAGWKARGIVDDERRLRLASTETTTFDYEEYREEFEPKMPQLSNQEIAALTWKQFTIPVISGAGTIAAAVGTHTIHTKRANAMAALYAVTSNKLDDMSEKAEELLGPKKAQQLHDEVAQKQIERDPLTPTNEVMMLGGTELCYDEWSGRYFNSSLPKLEEAINELNREIINEGDVSLNDFYERIGLENIPMGDDFGWSGPKIEGRFGSVVALDGRPALSIGFLTSPKVGRGH